MTLSWYSVGGHLNTNKESTEHSPISLVTISVLQLIPLDPQLTIKWGPLEHPLDLCKFNKVWSQLESYLNTNWIPMQHQLNNLFYFYWLYCTQFTWIPLGYQLDTNWNSSNYIKWCSSGSHLVWNWIELNVSELTWSSWCSVGSSVDLSWCPTGRTRPTGFSWCSLGDVVNCQIYGS